MDCIQSIQKAINYMEENILEDINYEDVASEVYMSNYHFQDSPMPTIYEHQNAPLQTSQSDSLYHSSHPYTLVQYDDAHDTPHRN